VNDRRSSINLTRVEKRRGVLRAAGWSIHDRKQGDPRDKHGVSFHRNSRVIATFVYDPDVIVIAAPYLMAESSIPGIVSQETLQLLRSARAAIERSRRPAASF
jgi:hypothetical protein